MCSVIREPRNMEGPLCTLGGRSWTELGLQVLRRAAWRFARVLTSASGRREWTRRDLRDRGVESHSAACSERSGREEGLQGTAEPGKRGRGQAPWDPGPRDSEGLRLRVALKAGVRLRLGSSLDLPRREMSVSPSARDPGQAFAGWHVHLSRWAKLCGPPCSHLTDRNVLGARKQRKICWRGRSY